MSSEPADRPLDEEYGPTEESSIILNINNYIKEVPCEKSSCTS